ncbi:MAG: DUF4011 domain-containing protein [Capnocytophaga sp.]|nr:MAG: DUF4011 domain-containing protein [Capnocytophaga sp.]
MEPFNKEIFDLFQQKLKVGNRRGVHLNAVVNNSRYKFDLSRLSTIFESLPERFVLDLLTLKNLKFTFSLHDTPTTNIDEREYTIVDTLEVPKPKKAPSDNKALEERTLLLEKLADGVDNLIFQSEAIFQEKGVNALGFGFPILARRDLSDGQITVAPVLIWSVRIRPTSQLNTWEVSRHEDDPIYLNEVLINHLQNDSHITLAPIPDQMLEDGKIDKGELFQICTLLLQQLKISQNLDFLENNYAKILPIKTKAAYEALLPQKGDALIEKAGLFSLFEVQKQNIINDYQTLKELFEPRNSTPKEDFQSFTSIPTDPSQQEILEQLRQQSHLLIQGPPGTGKSQTLTAILVNALENQQKVLVVCEKQTALEVLLHALQKRGLGKYTILIKDSIADRKWVVDTVRNILDDPTFKKAILPYPKEEKELKINGLKQLKEAINQHHKELFTPLLSGENWTELSGRMLQYAPEHTPISLQGLPLHFSDEEHNVLRETLRPAQRLYTPFAPYQKGYLYHPKTLIAKPYQQTLHHIETAFSSYKEQWAHILSLYEQYKGEYLYKRKEELSEQVRQLTAYIDEMEALTSLLPQDADQYNRKRTEGLFYRLSALFLSQRKEAIKQQKRLLWLLQEIKRISLHPNFTSLSLTDNLFANKEQVLGYREEIRKTKAQFEEKIEEDFAVLDVAHYSDPKFANDTLRSLVAALAQLKEQIKEANYIATPIEGTTFFDFKNYIEACLDQHARYQNDHNNPLEAGYQWFAFEQPLSPLLQRCVSLLIQAQATHWEASFLYAYYKAFLLEKSETLTPFSANTYEDFRTKHQDFASCQQEIISRYWDQAQIAAVKNFENQHKELTVANLYNKRRSEKHNRLSLREIASRDTDLFTTFFPIILTTPDSCCNLFQGKNFYFDYVVFDEASQLKLEDNLPAILKGKTVIIAGDEHQMPPSNYFSKIFEGNYQDEEEIEDEDQALQKNSLLSVESLLDFALDYKYDKHHLDFHYRSKHPYLINFSNIAFYNGKLRPLPRFESENPICFYQVDGTFHDYTNEAEALKVIEILREITPREDGSYPSVGVATFNITQRNLIRKKLLWLKSQEHEQAFAEKLTALEKAGLFIKNLENIQGDERDIIILSVTYGKKKDGKFTQSFGPLNQQKGYKLLNVIITRAKEKIYVCNSIPEAVFLNYADALAQEQANNRKAVLYAYLAYTKAVSEGTFQAMEEVLQQLSHYGALRKEATTPGQLLFKEAIFALLQREFPTLKLSQDEPFGGYTIDILLVPPTGKSIALECLSKPIYQQSMGYLEDLHKEQILREAGLDYMRIHADMPIENTLSNLKKTLTLR